MSRRVSQNYLDESYVSRFGQNDRIIEYRLDDRSIFGFSWDPATHLMMKDFTVDVPMHDSMALWSLGATITRN